MTVSQQYDKRSMLFTYRMEEQGEGVNHQPWHQAYSYTQ